MRHGETAWTLSGQYTGATDIPLTANGRREATLLPSLLAQVLAGQSPVVVTSPRQRAIETATLALPQCDLSVEPLVAEYDYGDYEGLTTDEIRRRAPGWDIWRDGCPDGESTDDVGARADTFLRTTVDTRTGPVVVLTHGHFSRILAARALGLAAESGRLFASVPASVSLVEDHDGERCLGLWNATMTMIEHTYPSTRPSTGTAHGGAPLLATGVRSS